MTPSPTHDNHADSSSECSRGTTDHPFPPPERSSAPSTWQALGSVALGAWIGGFVRVMIDAALGGITMPTSWLVGGGHDVTWPVSTLVVNVVGAFGLGFLTRSAVMKPHPALTLLAGTGLCGGLTTYSTFSAQTWTLAMVWPGSAIAWVGIMVSIGIAAAAAGWHVGSRR